MKEVILLSEFDHAAGERTQNLRPCLFTGDEEGVRVRLGGEAGKTDLFIEPNPNGWSIYLHRGEFAEPAVIVRATDDGAVHVVTSDDGEDPRVTVAKS